MSHKSSDPAATPPGIRLALGAVIPVCVLFAWWLGARSGSAVVPGFGEVWDVLSNPLEEPDGLYSRSLGFSIVITLFRLGLGYGLGVVAGVLLGIWAGRNRWIQHLLQPIVELARPINPIVLLPIITVLLGIASLGTIFYGPLEAWKHDVLDQVQIAMILIIGYGTFFPVYISTVHGVQNVRAAYVESLALMGASEWQTLRRVVLPHVLPDVANGMRIALGVSWLVIIAAEIFPGTRSGLGYMLCTACKTAEYRYTFAAILVIGVIGLLTNGILKRFEQRVSHWRRAGD